MRISIIVALACLGSIWGTAGIAYGQTEVQVFGTGLKEICANNELAFASLSTQLNDVGRTGAKALCLVLIPEGNDPVKRMFCSYRFSAGQRLRDDDSQGKPAPKTYKPESLNGNLTNFFKSLGCAAGGDFTARVADEVKTLIGEGNLSAQELTSRLAGIGSYSKRDVPNSLSSLLPVITVEAFPLAVHEHLARLKPISSPPESGTQTITPQQKITELENKLKAEKERADKLKGELDDRGGSSGDNWFWVIGAIAVSWLGTGLGFYWLGSKMNRGVREQRDSFIQVEQVKDKIYSGLIQDLHNNSQPGTVTSELLGEFERFEKELQNLGGGVEMSLPDEEKMREILGADLAKVHAELQNILPDEDQEKASKLQKVDDKLAPIFEYFFSQHQVLREHKDDVKERYYNLRDRCHGFFQFTSERLITNPQRNTPELEGVQNEHSGSGRRNPAPNQSYSQAQVLAGELDRRLGALTLSSSSGGILQELDSLSREMGKIRDRIEPYKKISLAETARLILSKMKEQEDELKRFQDMGALITNAEESLRNKSLMDRGEEFFHCVKRIAYDQRSSLDLLSEYGIRHAIKIEDKVKDVKQRLSMATEAILTELPEAKGTIDQLVTETIKELKRERIKAGEAKSLEKQRDAYRDKVAILEPEVGAGKELSVALIPYLGFNPKIASSDEPSRRILAAIRSESPEFQELRHRLRAVQIAFGRAAKLPDHERVIKALWIDEWLPHINAFLAEMQDFNNDELWNKGLYVGFTKQWLHYLLRADLLMNAYFSDSEPYFTLHDAVSQASRAVVATMHNYGVKVSEVKMFELPSQDVRQEATADESLRQLPEAEARIVQRFNESGLSGFVIDVATFPLRMGSERSSGRVVVMNPNNWLQKEKSD